METLVFGFRKVWAFQKGIYLQLSKKYERKYIATLTIRIRAHSGEDVAGRLRATS